MAKETTSQSQKKQPAFDPVVPLVMGVDAWARIAEESMGRMQSYYDELAKLENNAYAKAQQYMSNFNQFMTDSASYANDIAAEWRKLTIDATRRTAELFGAKA
jgi:hypothetical protein